MVGRPTDRLTDRPTDRPTNGPTTTPIVRFIRSLLFGLNIAVDEAVPVEMLDGEDDL